MQSELWSKFADLIRQRLEGSIKPELYEKICQICTQTELNSSTPFKIDLTKLKAQMKMKPQPIDFNEYQFCKKIESMYSNRDQLLNYESLGQVNGKIIFLNRSD